MEAEKTDNPEQDIKLKIPWSWKSRLLAVLLFVVLFCLFTVAYIVDGFVFNMILFAKPYDPDTDLGLGGHLIDDFAVALFFTILIGMFLNGYFAFYSTKLLFNKWYNKVLIFQETKKKIVLNFIVFMMVCAILNINIVLFSPSQEISRYAILLILVLSLYISQKIIKKLTKGVTHG